MIFTFLMLSSCVESKVIKLKSKFVIFVAQTTFRRHIDIVIILRLASRFV